MSTGQTKWAVAASKAMRGSRLLDALLSCSQESTKVLFCADLEKHYTHYPEIERQDRRKERHPAKKEQVRCLSPICLFHPTGRILTRRILILITALLIPPHSPPVRSPIGKPWPQSLTTHC